MRGTKTIRLIGLWGFILLYIAGGRVAMALETAGNPAIQDFSCRQEGGQTVVVVTADAAMDYTTSYPNPRLFLLDIPGAKLRLSQKFFDVRTPQVEFASIMRVGEEKELVRIEFNLHQPVHFDLKPQGQQLVLRFSSLSTGEAVPSDSPTAAISSLPAPVFNHGVLTFVEGENYQFTLKTAGTPSFKYFELKNPTRLVIDLENTTFSTQPQLLAVNAGPVGKIRFGYGRGGPGKIARCVFDLNQKSNFRIENHDSELVVLFPRESNLASNSSPQMPKEQPSQIAAAETSEALPTAAPPVISPSESQTLTAAIIPDAVPLGEQAADQLQKGEAVPTSDVAGLAKISAGLEEEPSIEANSPASPLSDSLTGPETPTLNLPEPALRAFLPVLEPASENLTSVAVALPMTDNMMVPQAVDLPEPAQMITLPILEPPGEYVSPEIAGIKIETGEGATEFTLPAARFRPLPVLAEPQFEISANDSPAPVSSLEGWQPTQGVLPAAGANPLSAPLNALMQTSPPDTRVMEDSRDFLKNIKLSQLYTPPPVLAARVQQETPPASPATPEPAAAVPLAPKPPAPAPAVSVPQVASGGTSAKYSGEPISLDLKEADIRDFMRLIGNISGLNVVLDPDVKGALTIFLNDVPWDQALDVVLKNNGLGKQLEGNVLRIAANGTLESEEQQRKRLADARILAAEVVTETRTLSYAKAAELSPLLKKVLSPRGDIIVDPRTNSMIISDISNKFPAIDALIKQLDRKIKQVEIEARVVAATRDFLRDIGVQWGLIQGNYQKNTLAGAVAGDPFARTPKPSVTMKPGQSGGAEGAMPLLVNLAANAPTAGMSFFAGLADNFLLDGIITAAENRGAAKLLSKPKISTQDNIEGFVQQGVKIPVQTTINNTVSVQFFDFALALTVTPQITEEGTIVMKVNITNSTPDFSRQVNGVPTVNTQETRTTVLVENGGTVVIGGVLVDNEQTNVRQVPGFGDLPLVGYLFKNKSITKQTQELIFFLSPKIM
jgi:type IV pilus secretin PilQ/predicted competence protein